MLDSYFRNGTIISTHDDQVIIGYGEKNWSSFPPKKKTPFFYFPDFFLEDDTPWFHHEHVEELSIHELMNRMDEDCAQGVKWDIEGESVYTDAFSQLMHDFRNGVIKKAVPYLFYTSCSKVHHFRCLSNLLKHSLSHPIYLYGFWDKENGMLGGSPEQLFHIDTNGILTTAAIAGTTRLKDEELLLKDPKLKLEHQLVIEGICDSLSPFGQIEVGKTQILRLAQLCHAKTPIHVQLNCKGQNRAGA